MKNQLAVTYRDIEALIPYARNARTHSDEQVAQIAGSIKEFGWTNPILLDGENGLIAGHGRLLAARKLGETKVPCIDLVGLSEAQKRAYIIADNRLAQNAGWDTDLLSLELTDLQSLDFDLGLLGFDAGELSKLLADQTEGLTDPDEAPEPPANPVTVPGDVWLCGAHRVMCGDRSKTTVWQIGRDAQASYVHPTQKPVALPLEAIMNSSKGADVVLDLFGGSGSTLIACEKSGRISHSMELDPKYCDVIVKRWQAFTGKQATLEGDGRTFDEISAERVPEVV